MQKSDFLAAGLPCRGDLAPNRGSGNTCKIVDAETQQALVARTKRGAFSGREKKKKNSGARTGYIFVSVDIAAGDREICFCGHFVKEKAEAGSLRPGVF